jgi:hypothetical protein
MPDGTAEAHLVTAGPGDTVKRYAFLLLALTACAAHVTSSLQVDGTAFVPTTCRSGQARGFAGVELADDQQRRLRLVQALDGTFQAVYFPPGHSVGQNLGSCGAMTLQNGIAVVNGIRNVEGSATLNCGGGPNTLKGSIAFEGCH